jgi:peptidoglycan/LPS O-acetylase OafA/YrhL
VVVLLHHSLLLVPMLAAPYFEFGHTAEAGTWAWWLIYSPLHILWEGTGAVYVFFVLSGIVLTLPVLKASHYSWLAFYPSRMIRLYVPVWGAVAFAVLTIQFIPRSGTEGSAWLQSGVEKVTTGNVIRDMTLVLGNGGLASPLWSLRWEILFSLALPIFVWLAVNKPRLNWLKLVACLAIVVVGGAYDVGWLYLPMFLVGSLIAVELPSLRVYAGRLSARRSAGLVWLGLIVLSVVLLSSRWLLPAVGSPSFALSVRTGLMLVGASLIVLCALFSPQVKVVLERPLLQWLGRISFSLYLIHEPIVVASAYVFGPGREWLAILTAIPTAVLVSWGFFRLIEIPSHKLAKSISARLARPGQVPAE